MQKRIPDDLQRSLDALQQGCSAEGVKTDELLARPLEEIVPFAERWNIPLEDLRDICQLLIQRLERLQVESARIAALVSPELPPERVYPAHRLPPHSLH